MGFSDTIMEWPNFKTFIAFLIDQTTFYKRILEPYHQYMNVYSIGSRYISDPIWEWD